MAPDSTATVSVVEDTAGATSSTVTGLSRFCITVVVSDVKSAARLTLIDRGRGVDETSSPATAPNVPPLACDAAGDSAKTTFGFGGNSFEGAPAAALADASLFLLLLFLLDGIVRVIHGTDGNATPHVSESHRDTVSTVEGRGSLNAGAVSKREL